MKEIIDFAKNNKDAFLAIAALGAICMTALTSLLSFLGILYQKKMDFKMRENESARNLFNDSLNDLGDAAYEVLAQATILIKKYDQKKESSPQEFLDAITKVKGNISQSKKILIDSRRNKRYSLLGVENAFQKIARIGDWVKNLETNTTLAKKLIKRGTKLRKIADSSIIRMHRYGKLPGKITICRVNYHCRKADNYWKKSRQEYIDIKDVNLT